MAARCRLKAEGARWAATRQRRLRAGASFAFDIEPEDRAIIARAKALPDCFLWMCHPSGPMPDDLGRYDDLAGCFEAAAAAAALLAAAVANPGQGEDLLGHVFELAAEAQSALRVAVAATGAGADADQVRIFNWLRAAGAARGIWIARYMRQDSPADPANCADLQERIRKLEEPVRAFQDRDKRRRNLAGKIRYHLKRIQANPATDHAPDWRTLTEAVAALVEEGVPPSNCEIREWLLPVLDELPEGVELPAKFLLVLREIDRFLASRPAEAGPAPAPTLTEEVRRAAELLRGRTVVLIGGEYRPWSAAALAAAFDLKEVIWAEGREKTYFAFEPHIANPDVAVVLLAIRWSSHSFGEVKEFCDKYGKPLVRLPAGYSPNQVAFHVMSQVGDRLATLVPRTGR